MTDNTLLTKRKQNEFIDLFEEINAETLLIEPVDTSNIELLSSASGSFDRKEWLKKLTEEGTFEKVRWEREVTASWHEALKESLRDSLNVGGKALRQSFSLLFLFSSEVLF